MVRGSRFVLQISSALKTMGIVMYSQQSKSDERQHNHSPQIYASKCGDKTVDFGVETVAWYSTSQERESETIQELSHNQASQQDHHFHHVTHDRRHPRRKTSRPGEDRTTHHVVFG